MLANDTNADGNPLTAVLASNPANGSVTLNSDGSFSYTPNAGFFGTDSFTYYDENGPATSNVATVYITVYSVPVANDDYYNDVENHLLVVPPYVCGWTDTFADANTENNALSNVPNVNEVGTLFQKTYGPLNAAWIDAFYEAGVTVIAVWNTTPTSSALTEAANLGLTILVSNNLDTLMQEVAQYGAVSVLANDTNADGNPLISVLNSGPANGTLLYFNADGTFCYMPNPGFYGTDSFTYYDANGPICSNVATVYITIYSVPVAVNDNYIVAPGATLTVSAPGVLANDTNVDGNPLTAVLQTGPSHGSLTLNANGSFSYTPKAGFSGTDSFTYYDTNGLAISNVATVTITVNNVPVAYNDNYNAVSGTTLNIGAPGVLANDIMAGGNPLTAVLKTGPANGTLTLNSNGSFSYTPKAGFSGTDTFTYYDTIASVKSNVATVTITVYSVPVANNDNYKVVCGTTLNIGAPGVLTNDTNADGNPLTAVLKTGPSHGSLTLNANGSFSYTPTAGFYGTDTFTYYDVNGPAISNTATVTILVYSVPVANPDEYSAIENQQLNVNNAQGVLANDYDADGDTMTAALYAGPADGTLALNLDGSFSYLPTVGFFGVDTFEYTASDSNATSSPALVTITVYSVPVANSDTYTVVTGNTLTGNVLTNDTNADGNTLSAVLSTGAASGTLTFPGDGTFSYTPHAGFVGTDGFTYSAMNGPATSTITTVTINVLGVPTANPDSYSMNENTTQAPTMLTAGSVLANDTVGNVLAPILSAQLVTPPATGVLNFNNDGTFTYLPPTYFVGTVTFTYEAVNFVGPSAPATVTITVNSTELPPTAYNGTLTVPANTATNGFLTSLNPAGGPIVYSMASPGTLGTVTITDASTGAYTYTPNLGASGTDTFTFSVAYVANPAMSSTATITVTIKGTPAAGVVVTANLPSAQVVGTTITFTATVTGIAETLQYEFIAQYKQADGTWATAQVISPWNSSNTCTWTPVAPNSYAVECYVCPATGPISYNTYGFMPYTILPDTITGVTLTTNVPSPQLTNTTIILAATAQDSLRQVKPQYQFTAQYRNPNGTWAPTYPAAGLEHEQHVPLDSLGRQCVLLERLCAPGRHDLRLCRDAPISRTPSRPRT